jgi:hypothetical protein
MAELQIEKDKSQKLHNIIKEFLKNSYL